MSVLSNATEVTLYSVLFLVLVELAEKVLTRCGDIVFWAHTVKGCRNYWRPSKFAVYIKQNLSICVLNHVFKLVNCISSLIVKFYLVSTFCIDWLTIWKPIEAMFGYDNQDSFFQRSIVSFSSSVFDHWNFISKD